MFSPSLVSFFTATCHCRKNTGVANNISNKAVLGVAQPQFTTLLRLMCMLLGTAEFNMWCCLQWEKPVKKTFWEVKIQQINYFMSDAVRLPDATHVSPDNNNNNNNKEQPNICKQLSLAEESIHSLAPRSPTGTRSATHLQSNQRS